MVVSGWRCRFWPERGTWRVFWNVGNILHVHLGGGNIYIFTCTYVLMKIHIVHLMCYFKTCYNSIKTFFWESGREKHHFVVPLIYAFTGWFLYLPWLGINPATSVHWDDTNQLSYLAGAMKTFFKEWIRLSKETSQFENDALTHSVFSFQFEARVRDASVILGRSTAGLPLHQSFSLKFRFCPVVETWTKNSDDQSALQETQIKLISLDGFPSIPEAYC